MWYHKDGRTSEGGSDRQAERQSGKENVETDKRLTGKKWRCGVELLLSLPFIFVGNH